MRISYESLHIEGGGAQKRELVWSLRVGGT